MEGYPKVLLFLAHQPWNGTGNFQANKRLNAAKTEIYKDIATHIHPQTHKIHRPIFGEMAHCVPASFTTWPPTQPELIPDQTLPKLVQSLHLRFLLQQLAGGPLAIFRETKDKFTEAKKVSQNVH